MKVYNKLVRDNIIQIIQKDNKEATYDILSDTDYQKELNIKLLEEVNEYLVDDNIEELADILEVIDAICEVKGVKLEDVIKIKENKRLNRGGFSKKIYLKEVK